MEQCTVSEVEKEKEEDYEYGLVRRLALCRHDGLKSRRASSGVEKEAWK